MDHLIKLVAGVVPRNLFLFFAGTIMMKKRYEGPTSGSLVSTVILRFRRNLRVD